jgi:hypothetical protein
MAVLTEASTEQLMRQCFAESRSRFDAWAEFIRAAQIQRMAEIGVYQGDFAAAILESCREVRRYYMIDPWRHLDDWNKPANEDDNVFENIFRMAKQKTDFASDRRIILRGKTTEVIDEIQDGELDFAYIDGDHTLKGIAIDMIRVYPKVRTGGFVGGDDFSSSIWQHKTSFEPTLVFPFAVYFAEAMGATIYALPSTPLYQFCLQKREKPRFSFVDLTGCYADSDLGSQLAPSQMLKLSLRERFPVLVRMMSKTRNLFS